MILNPFLSIRNFEENEKIQNIQTAAPKKNSIVKIESFYKEKNLSLFNALEKVLKDPCCISSLNHEEKNSLYDAQILINEKEISNYLKFKCEINESTKVKASYGQREYTLNPDVHLSSITCPPSEVERRLQNTRIDLAFEGGKDNILWVKDYITLAWWPYNLSVKKQKQISGLLNGSILISDLKEDDKNILIHLQVILPSEYIDLRKSIVSSYQKMYVERGSVHFIEMVNPILRKSLCKYLISLENEGFLRLGDFQSSTRFWAHNDIVNRYVQAQLAEFISEIVGEVWVPAFSYYVSYKEGSSLKKHLDRSQASLSLSLLIEYGSEGKVLEDQWPIFVEDQVGSDKYYEYLIGKGNGAIFEGAEYVHYRLRIPKGHYSMNMLFHFIRANFKGKVL